MTTVDYAAKAARAAASLARAGTTATITRATNGTYDVETATQAITTLAYTVTALETMSERSHIDGSLIEAGQTEYLVAAYGMTIVPKAGDVFTWQLVDYVIANVLPLNPAGTPILYGLHAVN